MPIILRGALWLVGGMAIGGGYASSREIGKGIGKSIPYAVGAVGLYYIMKARK